MSQNEQVTARRRVPTRFPRLYARFERSVSSMHAALHTWGTTEEERSLSFPCDLHVRPPLYSYYRGIDVLAPQETVYRWLCQLRAAPYAYDWIDNFGRQSPRQLTPGIDELSPGQRILFMFSVVEFVRHEQITMHGARFLQFFGDVAMTYRVLPREAGGCRIVSKLTAHAPGTYVSGLRRNYFPIAELPLMRKQLLTIKSLAEKQALEGLVARGTG
jgi:hypothetical protein